MQNERSEINISEKYTSVFSRKYWRDALAQLGDVRMLTMAALFVALRVVVKFISIPVGNTSLRISFDAYVNSIGSAIYGPMVGLMVGLASDILGELVRGRIAEFFLPFAAVEMASSFIFGLFFWRRKVTASRSLWAKFTVNAVCNMFMTTVCLWWMYDFYGMEKSKLLLPIDTTLRVVKNIIMFPLEAMIIVAIMASAVPMLVRLKVVDPHYTFVERPSNRGLVVRIILFTLLSALLVVAYFFFLEGYVNDFINAMFS